MDLDKYKQGDLTEEELNLFTGALIRAKFNQAQKDKWAQKLATEHQIQRDAPKVKFLQLHFRKLAIAAAILLLVALIPFLQNYLQPPSQQLANSYLENRLSLPDIKRGTTPETTFDLRKKARDAYINKDYPTASNAYEAILNSDLAKGEDYLFAGLSNLYNDQFGQAVKKLELAQTNIAAGQTFWEETNWFLSLAYLKNEEFVKAKQLLNKIIETDGFYSDQAQKILSTL